MQLEGLLPELGLSVGLEGHGRSLPRRDRRGVWAMAATAAIRRRCPQGRERLQDLRYRVRA